MKTGTVTKNKMSWTFTVYFSTYEAAYDVRREKQSRILYPTLISTDICFSNTPNVKHRCTGPQFKISSERLIVFSP